MRCKLSSLAHDRSSTSSCQARGQRLLPGSVALLLAFVGLAPSAFASIQFDRKWGTAGAGNGQFDSPVGIATHPAGNVYVADSQNHRVQKFNPSGAFITKWGSGGDGDGQFDQPNDVATTAAGNVYVADTENYRVQKFDSSGNFLRMWGWGVDDGGDAFQICTSSCQAGSLGSGSGQLRPTGVAIDSSGNVYVADIGNARIQKFNSSGTFITEWGTAGAGNGQFASPASVAIDSSDNVYVADEGNNRIQKFNSSGAFITKWGTYGTGSGQFDHPGAIDIDSSGNIYVAEAGNNRIQKFNSSGAFITKWGTAGAGNGQFSGPYGVATDSSGSVYVADTGNHRIQEFSPSTGPLDTTITSGPNGVVNDGTPRFTFSSSHVDVTFSCKLDSGSYASCVSPKTLSHLTDGPHTLYVRASDPFGTDPTPASRNFTVRTAGVSVSGTTLVVTAATGAKDNLRITRPSASVLRVTDFPSGPYTGSGVRTGAGCTRVGDYTANCTGQIAGIQITAGDQADQVVNSTGVQSSLFGGAANDILTGGFGNDSLTGGAGADVMRGMLGNDQLFGRDLTDDTTVNCDGGIGTPGSADRADLDLLPKDSPASGCETVTRH